MSSKRIDFLWISAQGLLFILYFMPIHLGLKAPELWAWPAQLTLILGLLEIVVALYQMRGFISPFPRPLENAVLLQGGVFAVVRHPIYSGIFLAAAAYGFLSERPFRVLIALLLLFFFYFKSRYEEKQLHGRFKEYAEYASKTGRFFPKLFGA